MTWVAVAVGGGMLIGGMYASHEAGKANKQAAEAAGNAAMLELYEARDVRKEAQNMGDKALKEQRNLAEATPAEMRALSDQYRAADKQLKTDERLLASVDPALLEASSQALKLLRGEEASSLAPLKNQRAEQRNALVNSLREQYGGSAESSSIGMKALQRFDSETAFLTNNAQQTSMGNLLGITAGVRPNLSNSVSAMGASLGSMGNIQSRKLGASQVGWGQLMANYTGTSGAVLSSAGAPYAGQVLSNQASANQWQNMSNQMFNTGSMVGGAYAGGYFGQLGKQNAAS